MVGDLNLRTWTYTEPHRMLFAIPAPLVRFRGVEVSARAWLCHEQIGIRGGV